MFKPIDVQMCKYRNVQLLKFYCEGGGASDLGDRWGHWQNVHIRLEAAGQPLNFGNLGGDVCQKNHICSNKKYVFYCGFTLFRILIPFS